MEQYNFFLYQWFARILLMSTDVTNNNRYRQSSVLPTSTSTFLDATTSPQSTLIVRSSSFCWKFCCRLSCIALRAMLIVRQQLFSLYRLSFPDATIDWSWSNTTPRLHTFQIHAHRSADPCALHRAVIASSFSIAPWQWSLTFSNFTKHFDFRSTA